MASEHAVATRVMNYADDSTDGPVSWETRFVDSGGTAYPGSGTMSNHSVKLLGEKGAPKVGDIPSDYAARWDATTSDGMTFTTSEGVGDVATWVDQTGTYSLDKAQTNEPIWTAGSLTIAGNDGLQEVTADFDATNSTLFAVFEGDGASGYDYMIVAPNEVSIGNQGGTDEKIAYVMYSGGTPILKTTQNHTLQRVVVTSVNDHIATDDNDKYVYFGKTLVGSDLTVADSECDRGYINVGWYIDTTRTFVGTFHEMIIYPRVLPEQQRIAVTNYLSAKWQGQNSDVTTPTIAQTRPNNYDDAYPINEFGSDLLAWWRSDVTAGMTFDSGDPVAGGPVSSWTDITRAVHVAPHRVE